MCPSVCLCPSLCSCGVNTWGELVRCLGKAGGRAGGRRRADPGLPVSLVDSPHWEDTQATGLHTEQRCCFFPTRFPYLLCLAEGQRALCPWVGSQVRQCAPCSNGDSGGCSRRLDQEAQWLPEEAKPGRPVDEGWHGEGRWAMALGSPREGCLHARRTTPGLEPGAHTLPANGSVTPRGPGLWRKGSALPRLGAASEAGGPRFRQSPRA